ncbi:MAG TPA: protein kinase [Armatimonadota bacterium]|nr:protein kinase [Armatimonadota bacterium]
MISTILNGRYVLEAEIGRGGMGTVYRATDLQLQRTVAVKALPSEFIHDEQFLKRFQNEVLNVAKLDHPNIVHVFDAGQDDGTYFYVMQLIDGKSLHAEIQRQRRLSLHEAVSILSQIAQGLDYAHTKGIVHRDVKPENVLIDENGIARIVDFGIARAADGTRLTGGMIGTPEYMSPEQARGEVLDGRADQYALALVAYEMLTGTTPFRGTDTQPWALVNMHISVPPPDPREYRSDLPEYTVQALLCALGKVAVYRFSTCSDFIKALNGEGSSVVTMVDPTGAPPTMLSSSIQQGAMNKGADIPSGDEKPWPTGSVTRTLIMVFLVGLALLGGVLIIKPDMIRLSKSPDQSIAISSPVPGSSNSLGTSDQQMAPARIIASAIMPPLQGKLRSYYYYPQQAFDNDPSTSWAPPTGEWRGAWIEATFPSPVTVSRLRVMPGLDRGGFWWKNNRLKDARVQFDGGRQQNVTFLDERRLQEIVISPAVETSVIRVTVDSVYPGSRWDDTVISTIEIWGHP